MRANLLGDDTLEHVPAEVIASPLPSAQESAALARMAVLLREELQRFPTTIEVCYVYMPTDTCCFIDVL